MKFQHLLVLVTLIYSVLGFGQILKVDKNHLASDSSGYTLGSSDLSFSANNRNSSAQEEVIFLGTKVGFDMVRIREKSATIWIGILNYTKLGDAPFISNGSGHLRQVFIRKAKLSPEIFVQFQYDKSRKMQFRRLTGAGLRWKILKQKNSLHLGLGLMNEQEEWGFGNGMIEKNIWKLNSYLGGKVDISNQLILNTIFYLQSGNDIESDVYRTRASGQLELKNRISKKMEAKLVSEFAWDQRPIIPLNSITYEFYFGLEYDF